MSPGKNERSNGVEGVKHIVPFFKTTEIHKGKLSWQGANTNYQDQKDLCNKGKLDRDVHSALHVCPMWKGKVQNWRAKTEVKGLLSDDRNTATGYCRKHF